MAAAAPSLAPVRPVALPVSAPAGPQGSVRCRPIGDDDLGAVIDLLVEGFPRRSRRHWTEGLTRLDALPREPGDPRYGFLLEVGGEPAGVLLALPSGASAGRAGAVRRWNLSSWYVRPARRAYASLLVFAALRRRDVVYTNLSAAPHTWSTIAAQGFSPYTGGTFFAIPLLARSGPHARAAIFDSRSPAASRLAEHERRLLHDHARFGCVSLVCVEGDDLYPFVFVRMRASGGRIPLPFAQLVWCRDMQDFVRIAAPVGRLLFRRLGTPVLALDARGPVPGLSGWYATGHRPRFFKGGSAPPRLGDLAYSELAVFGP